MTSRLLLSLSLALLAWQKAGAQLAPAADFFNSGAQFYISNNVPAALEKVELGRKLYPEDEKLKKLEELLKQQQQDQQQQQNDQQKKSDEQKQQEQKKQQQKPDKEQDNPQPDQQKDSDQKKPDELKPQEEKKDAGDKPKDEKPDQPPQGQPVKPGQMTPEEAKRLLDAQKGNEQLLPLKPEAKPRNPLTPVKDW